MLRVKDICEQFKISRGTMYEWIDKGCPVHYVGKLVFFDIDEVVKWVKEQKNKKD